MNESNLPRWSVRLDVARPPNNPGFEDLISLVNQHFRVHQEAETFLGPYNARQRNSTYPYSAPDRDALRQLIRQGGMNDFSYAAYLNSIIRFCEQTKGLRAVPTPHPSTIHSIQLPLPAFELKQGDANETNVFVIGIPTPLVVKRLRDLDMIKFIIVRPKLSQLGTASTKNWEVLFFRSPVGYIPDWADSMLNPKYSGIL